MTEQNTQQQKSFKILLIGDACNDTYTYGYVNRISPEAPVPVFEPHYTIHHDGMAGNVRKNLECLSFASLIYYLFYRRSSHGHALQSHHYHLPWPSCP